MSYKPKDNFNKPGSQEEEQRSRSVSGSSNNSQGSFHDSGYEGSPGSKKFYHPEIAKINEEISINFGDNLFNLYAEPFNGKEIIESFKSLYQKKEERITSHTNSNNRFSWSSLDRKIGDFEHDLDNLMQDKREGISLRMIISSAGDAIFNRDILKLKNQKNLGKREIGKNYWGGKQFNGIIY